MAIHPSQVQRTNPVFAPPPTIAASAGLNRKIATRLEELRRPRIVIDVRGPSRR